MPASPTRRMIVLQFSRCSRFLRAVEQHVVPVGGVEVLDRFELEAGRVDLAAQGDQLVDGPELIRVAGQAPALLGAGRLVVARIVRARLEIIDEVGHNMGGPRLTRELEVLRRQHVAIESEPELHGLPPRSEFATFFFAFIDTAAKSFSLYSVVSHLFTHGGPIDGSFER